MYACSQNLLSVSLSEYSVIKRNRSVPCKFISDSEYSVIKNDVIKRFDCSNEDLRKDEITFGERKYIMKIRNIMVGNARGLVEGK